jgi:hypothetical protein
MTSIFRAQHGRVNAWACNNDDVQRLLSFYNPDMFQNGKGKVQGQPRVGADFGGVRSRDFEPKDLPDLR